MKFNKNNLYINIPEENFESKCTQLKKDKDRLKIKTS